MNRRAELSADRLSGLGFEAQPAGWRRALAEGDPVVRADAAFLLGEQPDDDSASTTREVLVTALRDIEARIRVEAAYALVRRGLDVSARAVLRQELDGTFFADAPLRAARYLAHLGDARGYPRVIEALASDLPSVRMEAIAVLPDFQPLVGGGSPSGDTVPVDPVSALRGALSDPEPMLRADAQAALDRLTKAEQRPDQGSR